MIDKLNRITAIQVDFFMRRLRRSGKDAITLVLYGHKVEVKSYWKDTDYQNWLIKVFDNNGKPLYYVVDKKDLNGILRQCSRYTDDGRKS